MKFLKFLFVLVLLGALAAAGYYGYDYYQNPEKYEEVEQIVREKLNLMEVSPYVTPEMTLSLAGTYYEDAGWVCWDENDQSKPLIMCYGKDLGGNVYVPRDFHILQNAVIYGGPNLTQQDVTEYVTQNVEYKRIEIKEELLMSLDAGEYYIVCYFLTEEGEGPYPALIPLIVEEETTFNSTQSGFVNYADEYGWIVNDLYDVKEISFTFYNLGDNPIRAIAEVTNYGRTTTKLDPDDYYINERGDTVTLKAEYLKHRQMNTTGTYIVIRSDSNKIEMDYAVVGTVRGDSLQRMTITGPATYSHSVGGDYVATYEPNMCDSIYGIYADHFLYGGGEIDLIFETEYSVAKYLDQTNRTFTIPEEIMQTITPNSGNTVIQIGYFYNDVWFNSSLTFNVVD